MAWCWVPEAEITFGGWGRVRTGGEGAQWPSRAGRAPWGPFVVPTLAISHVQTHTEWQMVDKGALQQDCITAMSFVFCFLVSHSLPKICPQNAYRMLDSSEYRPLGRMITFTENTLSTILSRMLRYALHLLVLVFCPTLTPSCYSVLVFPCIIFYAYYFMY